MFIISFLILDSFFLAYALPNLQDAATQEMTTDITIMTAHHFGASRRSGSDLELHCGITNADKAVISWWKGETKLSDGIRTLTNDTRINLHVFFDKPFLSPVDGYTNLIIRNLRMSDAGQYKCTATPLDKTKKVVSHSQDVQVEYHITPDGIIHVDILEGNALTLSCKISGVPKPVIKWMVEDTRERKRDLPQFNGVQNVTIAQINYTEAGRYNCLVDDGKGDPYITTTVAATVIYSPKFADNPFGSWGNVSYARIGSQAFLTCYFAVNPPGTYSVKWFHKLSNPTGSSERAEIVADGRHEIGKIHLQAHHRIVTYLKINNVQEGDLGKCICAAKNERGSAEGEVDLLKKD